MPRERQTSTLSALMTIPLLCGYTGAMAGTLIIDDRQTGDMRATLGPAWRLVTDTVMGGESTGQLTTHALDARDCLRLTGDVRLDNRGGFIQAALDIEDTAAQDATAFSGIALDVYGNNEAYNVHLRTIDTWLPWQAYRATFQAAAGWQRVKVPFSDFSGYRIGKPLNPAKLERIGILAIGRAFSADLCVARVALYSASPAP